MAGATSGVVRAPARACARSCAWRARQELGRLPQKQTTLKWGLLFVRCVCLQLAP